MKFWKTSGTVTVVILLGKIGIKNALWWVNLVEITFKIYKHLIRPFMKDTGIITNEEGKEFGKFIDPLIPLENVKIFGVSLDKFDDDAVAYAVNFADNKWGDKLPEDWRPALRSVFVELPKGNTDNLASNLTVVTDGLIQVKNEMVDDALDIMIRKNLEGIIEVVERHYVLKSPVVD